MEYTQQQQEPVIKALTNKAQYTELEAQQTAVFCLQLAPVLLKIWGRMLPKHTEIVAVENNPINQ